MPMIGFGILIPLFLLVGLGISWFVLRRTLLPQTKTKLPPSGARPWSRTRVPSPDSLVGNIVVASNAGSIALSQGPLLSDTSTISTASGTLPTMPATSSSLAHTNDILNTSFDVQVPFAQNNTPQDGTRYWKIQEEDLSLAPDDLPPSIQGGSHPGFTRYWKMPEDNSNAAGAADFPPGPFSAYTEAVPLSGSENPAERANGDDSPNDPNSFTASLELEKGLLTNAPYYTKLPKSEQTNTWEYEEDSHSPS